MSSSEIPRRQRVLYENHSENESRELAEKPANKTADALGVDEAKLLIYLF